MFRIYEHLFKYYKYISRYKNTLLEVNKGRFEIYEYIFQKIRIRFPKYMNTFFKR